MQSFHGLYYHHSLVSQHDVRNKEITSLHYTGTKSLHFLQYDLDVGNLVQREHILKGVK